MISVVIPLYNKEAIVERSLQSVLTQDFRDFEVVVVDDGSTDRSAEIVRSISDTRLRLVSQENGGPSKARNTGVREARGEWIVFLDADDELLPGALENYDNLIKKYPEADFIACSFYNQCGKQRTTGIQQRERKLDNPFKEHVLGRFFTRTGAFACKRELLSDTPFNEQIRRFEDLEFLFRIYKKAHIVFGSPFVMTTNQEFAAASSARKDIREDFMGHLPSLRGKGFWEQQSLYKFFIGERDYYPEARQLYPSLSRRYDLLLAYKIIGWLRRRKI